MTVFPASLGEGLWTAAEVLVPVAIALLYLARTRHLASEGRPVAPWRQICFASGLVVIAAATASPIETVATELVSVHMAQHLLLADLASLLFVLGTTGPVLQPLLSNRLLRPLRHLAHPVPALGLFTLNVYLWHLPVLYQAVLHSTPLHVLEHLSFVFFGVFLWMPLFGPLPRPQWFGRAAHVVYTAGIWLTGMALANAFMWSGTVFYPDYSAGAAAHGLSPIADQSIAGGILMGWCMVMALAIFTFVFLRWAQEDTERQELLDLADMQGVPLSDARATRAASAGTAERLRTRIEQDAAADGLSNER